MAKQKSITELQKEANLEGRITRETVKRSDTALREGDPDTGFALSAYEAHNAADGPDEIELVHQEGYGFWPVCGTCGEQVEPTSFSAHNNEHGG